ncbi:MAG: hypothetical protein KDJ67_08245, partial [Nitratireductor sp.]|nr:hypothetical protein [Nitratireductor sp.]
MPTTDLDTLDENLEFAAITPANAIDFASILGANAGSFDWLTTGGDRVRAIGSFTYDPGGNPTSGTVTSIGIDLSNDNDYDVVVELIPNADILTLISGHENFLRELFAGNDTFTGTFSTDVQLSGDSMTAVNGETGGTDNFDMVVSPGGDLLVTGDFYSLYAGVTATGGDDTFLINDNSANPITVIGDANSVFQNATLLGGKDIIQVTGVALETFIIGDVVIISGTLVGGDDEITTSGAQDSVYGDAVGGSDPGNNIHGGNDRIYAGAGVDEISGDTAGVAGVFVGGKDELHGEAGNDTIVGDTFRI